jgi:hypothetical protein
MKVRTYGRLGWGVNGTRPEPEHRLCTESHRRSRADDLAEPCAAVFLSHQQAFGTRPTACIRFAVLNRIEILHILLEHSYDSRATRTRAQLADFIGGSQSRGARICPVRSDSSSGGLPSSDRLHTSSRRIRAASRRCLAAAIVAGPRAGRAGSRIPGALLAAAATGRCGCGIGRRRSNRLPVD